MLSGLLVVVLLVSASAMVYRAATSPSRAAISPEQTTRPALLAVTSSAASGTIETPPTANTPVDETATPRGESIALAEPLPASAALAFDTPRTLPSGAPAPPLETAKPKPPPTQAELKAALTATPIVMYGTTWCGVCRSARQFMADSGLRYQEIDPDRTPGGWDKVAQLIGRRAVPVIIVDGEVTGGGGLSPQRVMDAVARSMERRLGVTGIRFKAG